MDQHAALGSLHPGDPHAGVEDHALLLQVTLQRRADLRLLEGDDAGEGFQHSDRHAGPGEDLRELQTHRVGADHDQGAGQLPEGEGLRAGEVSGLRQAGDRGRPRPGAGGQDHPGRGESLPIDRHRPALDEAGPASEERDLGIGGQHLLYYFSRRIAVTRASFWAIRAAQFKAPRAVVTPRKLWAPARW